MLKKFMRRADVEAATGLKHSSIYAMMARHEFPQAIKITDHAVAWLEEEIVAWQEKQILRTRIKVTKVA